MVVSPPNTARPATLPAKPPFISSEESEKNGMILAHNHPSGHLEPSKEDLARKEELQQLGKLMGIYLHDFLIVSTTGAKSLMDCKSE